MIDVRFVAGIGFEFRTISLVPHPVVRRVAIQHHLALHRSIQCKARIHELGSLRSIFDLFLSIAITVRFVPQGLFC